MLCLFNRKKKFSNDNPQSVLIDSGGASGDRFGNAVALSADGSTAIVGSSLDDVGANNDQGSAIVFTKSGNPWNEETKLLDSTGSAQDGFGNDVALSDDGNTALVGSYFKSGKGAAIVFTRSGGIWTQQAELTDSTGAANNYFGLSVALSSDGNTALVGSPYSAVGGTNAAGSVLVFTRSGGIWTQQTRLSYSAKTSGDQFGFRVALSADNTTALIGVIGDDPNGKSNQGSAVVFTQSMGTWTEQSTLTYNTFQTFNFFGYSVALSNDGNTALVGASGGQYAVVFTRSGSTWTLENVFTGTGSSTGFGRVVALSGEGDIALIGAPLDDVPSIDQGSVTLFIKRDGVWSEETTLVDNNLYVDNFFGTSVALSKNNNIILIGATGFASNRGYAKALYRR